MLYILHNIFLFYLKHLSLSLFLLKQLISIISNTIYDYKL